MIRILRLAAVSLLLAVPPALAFDRGPPAQTLGPVTAPSATVPVLRMLGAVPPLERSLETTYNPNAIIMGLGNSVSMCPLLSCLQSPTAGHQRASAWFSAQTQDDGHSQEQTVGITTTIKTGYAPAWIASRAYSLGDNVTFEGGGRNEVYRATQAGTSAASGGPTGKGSGIVDGTVRWAWINDAAINAKVGLYNEVATVAGAGHSWAQANNLEMRPGTIPTFHINTEFDLSNHTGVPCTIGQSNCNNLYVVNKGDKTTTGIAVTTSNGSSFATYWGMRFNGDWLASDATLEIDTKGLAAIGIGRFSPAAYSVAALDDISVAPVGVNIGGTKSVSGFREASITPVGLLFAGTYSVAQVQGAGWSVALDGGVTAKGYSAGSSPGVSCSGPPTSNFQVTNGIVTRC